MESQCHGHHHSPKKMVLSQGTDGVVGGGQVERKASVAIIPTVFDSHQSHAVALSLSQESAERCALQQVMYQLSLLAA